MRLRQSLHSRPSLVAVFAMLFVLSLGCSRDAATRESGTLRIAVVPDQKADKLRIKYQPLLDQLASETGSTPELLIPGSYQELLQWFDDKKVDVALFGGATYVKAHLQSKAVPLVMRREDGRFRSVALVRTENPASSLEDLKDAKLAFGSRLSTSGHFMPRYFLQQRSIRAEDFFAEVIYSGAHDLTAEWVRDGRVDVGVVNSGIANEMFLDGRLTQEKVKVVWQSPPYSDYVWATQPGYSKKLTTLLRDAFLDLGQTATGKQVLKVLGASYYIPASHEDFVELEQVMQELEGRESTL